jgi:2-polyprenyl-6-methoxyphenol hydroxylase-like FAD-dependent oxidoreductase
MHRAIDPVAVIGNGIAGIVACLRLKALGIDPVWIAPANEPKDKPGEHLAPAAHPLLNNLDAGHLLEPSCHRPANTMFSAWGSARIAERNAIVHLEGPGTVLHRSSFEGDLSNLAVQRGIRRIHEAVNTVTWKDDHWELETKDTVLRSLFVIDASGRSAVLARAQAQRFRADQLVALVAFPRQSHTSDVAPTRATLIEAVADGWWYASLLGDGRLALNYYTDPDLLPRDVTRDLCVFERLLNASIHIARWLTEADFRLSGPPNLVSAGTTWMAPAAGARWAAVGDAAAAFDPLSSHGMTTAMWTAITVAEAIPGALKGSNDALLDYALKVADGVQEYLVSQTRVYSSEVRFSGSKFWQRRQRNQDEERLPRSS